MNNTNQEVTFTKKEIFDIYGLFIGMMTAEANSETGHKPATKWYYYWAEHPSLTKARIIYNEVRKEKESNG